VALVAISILVQPDWPSELVEATTRPVAPSVRAGATQRTMYEAPVMLLPFGPLLLLALSRWRRPEARLLATLAVVPQTMMGYELVPLLALIPAKPWQAFSLAVLSWGVYLAPLQEPQSYHAYFLLAGKLSVVFVFLPALLLVLSRPNEGEVPAWIDRLASRRGSRVPRRECAADTGSATRSPGNARRAPPE
jgi:hypothetical protein